MARVFLFIYMSIKNIIKEEVRNIVLESNNKYSGETFICIDIQKEYSSGINFLEEWVDFINKNHEDNKIVLIWNGPEVGGPEDWDYKMWLMDIGIEEDAFDYISFQDKYYAFFRDPMDEGIDLDDVLSIIKFMHENNINDSREIDDDKLNDICDKLGIEPYMFNGDGGNIYIPDIMDYIDRFDNFYLMGGGEYECLAEIELLCQLLGKNFKKLSKFIY